MKFNRATCPQCGGDPDKILEQVLVDVELMPPAETGEIEYGEESSVAWDTSEPVVDRRGRVTLYCSAGHAWLTSIKEPKKAKNG